MSKIEIFNEDCMEGMKRYSDKHFDLAIVDPPYGMDVANRTNFRGNKNHKSWKNRETNMILYIPKQWDKKKPEKEYFKQLFKLSKNQIIWGGNHFLDFLGNTSCCIFWDKKVTDNSADGEIAWTSFKTAVRKFEWLWNGYKKERPEKRFHPTQKPVALYRWLLKNYSKEGDLILDTHLGSGSIAIACWDMGFDLVGFEIDKDYYEGAMKRLHEHQQQGKFDFSPAHIG